MHELISAFANQKFCSVWEPTSPWILHPKNQKYFSISKFHKPLKCLESICIKHDLVFAGNIIDLVTLIITLSCDFFCVIFLCLWIDKVLLSCCCYCSVWTLSMWSRDSMRDKMYDCRKMTFVSFLCKSLLSDMTKVAKFTKWFLPAVYCTARWTRLMLVSSFTLKGCLMAEYFER